MCLHNPFHSSRNTEWYVHHSVISVCSNCQCLSMSVMTKFEDLLVMSLFKELRLECSKSSVNIACCLVDGKTGSTKFVSYNNWAP